MAFSEKWCKGYLLRCSLGLEPVFNRLDCKSIHVGVRKYKCMRGLIAAGIGSESRVIPAVFLGKNFL